jgi:hypothetical protein
MAVMPSALSSIAGHAQVAPRMRARSDVSANGVAPTVQPTTKPGRFYVNPDYQFDPALGLVVVQFHDASGKLTNSIPSQRQLEEYKAQQAHTVKPAFSLSVGRSHETAITSR